MKKKICKHIVKRKGMFEEFDERKVYASCFAACLSSHMKPRDAEKVCEKVAKDIKIWIKPKGRVSSDNLFKQTIKSMKKHSKDAAFMYETHRDIN